MFKSSLTIKALFEQVRNDSDVAVKISDESLLFWYNELIRFLYLEIIKGDTTSVEKIILSDDTIMSVSIPSGIETVKAVICDGYPALEGVTELYALATKRPCYYESDGNTLVLCNVSKETKDCTVVSYEVPSAATSASDTAYVPLPNGFVSLAKYKLLGEMYGVANDNDLAAKNLGFYNTMLADFKVWLSGYYRL